MCLPCGARLMFVKDGGNPVKKVNYFKMNYNNLNKLSPSHYATCYYIEKENMKYKGISCSEDNQIIKDEMYVDIDFLDEQNYKGLLDITFFSILHEIM
jgi:hypothetical protein